jgi:hypothetical protein
MTDATCTLGAVIVGKVNPKYVEVRDPFSEKASSLLASHRVPTWLIEINRGIDYGIIKRAPRTNTARMALDSSRDRVRCCTEPCVS